MSTPALTAHRRHLAWIAFVVLIVLPPSGVVATFAAVPQSSLVDLSLEELMDVEVTSAGRKPQRAGDVAAAVFVISQDDIRRSGATSVPEVLRMAPGIEVARIDANKWAVTARGFNGRFANKLLVLLDGRSVYTRLFSGVFWDTLDTELADIDRIEVIRGPGAAVWGANAVNGVINIITKRASETQGAIATGGVGGEERGFGSIRHGGELGEGQGHYRVYGKYLNRDGAGALFTGQPSGDSWHSSRGGFRLDYAPSSTDRLALHGDAYGGSSGETVLSRSADSIVRTPLVGAQQVRGGSFLARWERASGAESSVSLQGYFSRADREAAMFEESRTTVDFEYQQRLKVGSRHDLMWGGGVRSTFDDIGGSFSISMDPASSNDRLASSFIQDEIVLVPDHLRLTVGARLEHTNYAGVELQPSARLLWKLHERHSVWTAASRAARTPSRGDRTARLLGLVDLGQGGVPAAFSQLPVLTLLIGSDQLTSEHVSTFEIGYRAQPHDHLGVDLTAFYSDYDNLRSVTFGSPTCGPSGETVAQNPSCVLSAQYLVLPAMFGNGDDARLYGFEATTDWRAYEWLHVQPSYSYLGRADRLSSTQQSSIANVATGLSPQHQLSLRSGLDIGRRTQVDGWLRHVGRLTSSGIAVYTTLDARVAWQVRPNLEVSVVAQNLLDASHPEFVSELGDIPLIEIQRSAYVQFRWVIDRQAALTVEMGWIGRCL